MCGDNGPCAPGEPPFRAEPNDPAVKLQLALTGFSESAKRLARQCGHDALAEALFQTYLDETLTHGDIEHARRKLDFMLNNLDELAKLYVADESADLEGAKDE